MLLEGAEGDEMAVQLEGGHAVGDHFLGPGGSGVDLGAEFLQRSARFGGEASEPGVDVLGEGRISHFRIPACICEDVKPLSMSHSEAKLGHGH